jgi:glycosyltransferase involved in cell wall biosynthesis
VKILVVMLSVAFAGTERHAVELANEMSCQGHDVAMLLRRQPSELHRLAQYRALRSAISPRIPVFLASRVMPRFALWRALVRFRPDIVHAHSERAVRITSRYAARVPLIATVHMHFRGRDFMRCDGLICLTETEARGIVPEYPGSRFVIGNWVRPHQRPSDAILAARRTEFGIAADDYVVGTVARLDPGKGIADLITAFHAANLAASRLMIVGDGSQRAELESLVARLGLADRVTFTGFRSDVRDLYFLMDVFVLNSVSELYGLVVLEAAASGLPVIAAATSGTTAIAETLKLELIQPGSPALMTNALLKVYQQLAPAYDMSSFAVEQKVRDTVDAYRAVIAARSAT